MSPYFLSIKYSRHLSYYFVIKNLKKLKKLFSVEVSGIVLCMEIIILYQKSYLGKVSTIPETRFKRDSHE